MTFAIISSRLVQLALYVNLERMKEAQIVDVKIRGDGRLRDNNRNESVANTTSYSNKIVDSANCSVRTALSS